MSYFHFDRNNEQILAPITIIRGGTSRAFFFEGRNVPPPGGGLEEFLLAVRGSPDPMGMDGLGGDNGAQCKCAIVSPSTRSDADVDYTFIQIFPDQPAGLSYKMNCGNISAGVPVFALMKNMIPNVPDGRVTIRVFSTTTQKMMYMTLDVLNGEARVAGDTIIGGVPGTGAEILVDFREQGGGFTGRNFPTGNLVDRITLSDGSSIDVTIMDMVNLCGFFDAAEFGIGYTGLELPATSGAILDPPGMLARLSELRLKIAQAIGWNTYTMDTVGKTALPWAVSVAPSATYTNLNRHVVKAEDVDLVARFYIASSMHFAAPGSGSTCLAAASAIPGTVPNKVLREGTLKSGNGDKLTFGHPSGTFLLNVSPVLSANPNAIAYSTLNFARTARILCDGTVYIKNNRLPDRQVWAEVDELTAQSFFLHCDSVVVQK